jgi:AraC-like DNA-binding protein
MSSRDSTRWDLEHALSPKSCAICRLSQKGIARFVDGLLYESVSDPDVRRRAAQSLGFCHRHAWQMRTAHGSALGIAFLNRDALNQWQAQLERAHKPRAPLERFREQVAHASHAEKECLVCERQNEIEQRGIQTLLESLLEQGFRDTLRQSAGLCRPHFAQACAAAARAETLQALVEIQMEINAHLLAELDEFIRKNDYRFMAEGFGAEGDAWIRAIERLAGAEAGSAAT